VLAEPAGESWRQLRVHQKLHASRGDNDAVVRIAGGVGDARADVFLLQVGEAGQNLLL
jgi:hypothetical protein